jgi:hypothetical protein
MFASDMSSLAGGFHAGDRAIYAGKPVTIIGPPKRAAAARLSVAVRFDGGHHGDVRVNDLQRGSVESEASAMVYDEPYRANLDESGLPVADTMPTDMRQESPGMQNYSVPAFQPQQRAKPAGLKKQKSFASGRMVEDVKAPVKYVKGDYPTANFKKYVIEKDPLEDKADSPDTQTIVSKKAQYRQSLPTDPILRQKELVRMYTLETQLYPQMNLALRQDDETRLKYFGAFIHELRDVFFTDKIDQIIEPFLGTVWRGITVPDVNGYLADFQPDAEFVWESFTSTTTDKYIANIFGNLLFEIHCTPPATGTFDDDMPEYAPADIKQFSDTKEETEVLFPPNVRFRVITVQMPTGQLGSPSIPTVICETVGYDSIWGLIDANNKDEVAKWCSRHPHLIKEEGFTHSVLHAAIDSGSADCVDSMLRNGANMEQLCPVSKVSARKKLEKHTRFAATIKPEPARPNIPPPRPAAAVRIEDARHSGPPLAGGFYPGDRVVRRTDGARGVVKGPPARKPCFAVSVAAQFEGAGIEDVRVVQLDLA